MDIFHYRHFCGGPLSTKLSSSALGVNANNSPSQLSPFPRPAPSPIFEGSVDQTSFIRGWGVLGF